MVNQKRYQKLLNVCAGGFVIVASTFGFTSPSYADDDYSKSIQLQWDGGNTYTSEIGESFVGLPITVPGDSTERTLHIKNDGPTSGKMRISIINVQLKNPDAADTHHNPNHTSPGNLYTGAGDQGDFYDDVIITSKAQKMTSNNLTTLDNNDTTVIDTIDMAKGQEQNLTIGFNFDESATSGNKANVDERMASFDVLIEIGGDLPEEPTIITPPVETPQPTPTPSNSTTSKKPVDRTHQTPNKNNDVSGSHARTGDEQLTNILKVSGISLFVIALLLTIFGFFVNKKSKNN